MNDRPVIAVAGGRDYADRAHVFRVLDGIGPRPGFIIHGGCGLKYDKFGRVVGKLQGADRWASEWAEARDVRVRIYPADWDRYGSPAGPRRNGLMLKHEMPDMLVTFPGGAGTQSAYDIAVTLEIPIHDVRKRPTTNPEPADR